MLILEAAEKVFAEAGFGGATMQLIADMAGLPKANLHYYFATKEDLYRRVVQRHFRNLAAGGGSLDNAPGPVEGIGAYIEAKMEISRTHPHGSKVWASEVMHGAPVIQDYLETTLRDWTEGRIAVIQRWIDEGQDGAGRSAPSALHALGHNPALRRFRPPDRNAQLPPSAIHPVPGLHPLRHILQNAVLRVRGCVGRDQHIDPRLTAPRPIPSSAADTGHHSVPAGPDASGPRHPPPRPRPQYANRRLPERPASAARGWRTSLNCIIRQMAASVLAPPSTSRAPDSSAAFRPPDISVP
jgi:AcrR family transcriptional regulator